MKVSPCTVNRMTVLACSRSGNVTELPWFFSYLPFHNLCCDFEILHIISVNQILLFVFNAPANAAESDKRDLIKELDTMKRRKPHPYIIKLLGCVTESGTHFLLMIDSNACSSLMICFNGKVTGSQLNTTKKPSHKVVLSFFSQYRRSWSYW